MSIFNKRTGDYTKPSDLIGRLDDTLLVPLPGGIRMLDDSGSMHLSNPGAWTVDAQRDFDIIVSGSRDVLACQWILDQLVQRGLDPRSVWQLSRGRRENIGNDLIRAARREQNQKMLRLGQTVTIPAGSPITDVMDVTNVRGQKLSDVLLTARDTDMCELERDGTRITVAAIKKMIMESYGLTPEQFALLDDRQKARAKRKILRAAQRLIADQSEKDTRHDAQRAARTALHVSLRQWALGPLKLERPQSSSLHHLMDYECGNTDTDNEFRDMMGSEDTQVIIVENDWAAAVPPQTTGEEWPLPFEKCCWEFRISGVRVLAFTHAEPIDDPAMFCVYGRDRTWVIDDYVYRLGQGEMIRDKNIRSRVDAVEFPRVARLAMEGIRASCIMMDAGVCEREHVAAPRGLLKKRALEKKAPLRDHYVVSLLRRHRRAHVARSAGGAGSGTRQRGHWRPGRYLHYDRQDAGQIQYVNDGGFIVSKTWQRWHFAGDPNNIIHKEYKL